MLARIVFLRFPIMILLSLMLLGFLQPYMDRLHETAQQAWKDEAQILVSEATNAVQAILQINREKWER